MSIHNRNWCVGHPDTAGQVHTAVDKRGVPILTITLLHVGVCTRRSDASTPDCGYQFVTLRPIAGLASRVGTDRLSCCGAGQGCSARSPRRAPSFSKQRLSFARLQTLVYLISTSSLAFGQNYCPALNCRWGPRPPLHPRRRRRRWLRMPRLLPTRSLPSTPCVSEGRCF